MTIESTLIKYESSRQEIKRLNSIRHELFSKCTSAGGEWRQYSCVNTAYHELVKDRGIDDCNYEEFFFHIINDGVGACEKCKEAMAIKVGPMAKAKKDFGAAKRAISAHGKRLIKNQERGDGDG